MNRCAGYGVALAFAFLTAVSAAAAAAQERVLHRFRGGPDGDLPGAGLIADAKGVLYGTTAGGGIPSCDDGFGCGTVFALVPPAAGETRWTETVLYRFRGGRDGSLPYAGLIADATGTLYGTTTGGGDTSCDDGFGCGTVFALTPPTAGETRWTETVLYRFRGGRDGRNPQDGLIADAKGVLYGTTELGGDASCISVGCGTVFALTPPTADETRWTETVRYRFRGGRDGAFPYAGLIADAKGVLYGTTHFGGDNNHGTVFALTPPASGETRWTETVLYSFPRGRDGRFPYAGLIADAKGVLYGTTVGGGDTSSCTFDCGTVFALSPPSASETRWTHTVLYSFTGAGGSFPLAGLIADAKGVLYGTTELGGGASCSQGGISVGCGTVFALSPPAAGETQWTQTVLHRFLGGRDGAFPYAGLIADAKGVLYGTTTSGGDNQAGTVFAISPPAAGETR